jgi:hypothetical protein
MSATKSAPALPTEVAAEVAATLLGKKSKAPAAKAPAAATKPTPIKILVAEPALRGSRAARWPIVAKAKTVEELRKELTEAGFNAAGTLRWLAKAKLVQIG